MYEAELGALNQSLDTLATNLTNYAINSENNKTNVKLAAQQNEFARQMADTAWQRNLEQWHRANKYNSPSAQMQRYQDAGLNPNLIYGQQNTAASTAPSYQAPPVERATVRPFQVQAGALNFLGAYQDMKLRQAQINNVSAQTEQIKQETANKLLYNTYLGLRNQFMSDSNPLRISRLKLDNDYYRDYRGRLAESQLDYRGALTRQAQQNIEFMLNRMTLNDAQRLLYDSNRRLMDSQTNWNNQRNKYGFERLQEWNARYHGIPVGDLVTEFKELMKEFRNSDNPLYYMPGNKNRRATTLGENIYNSWQRRGTGSGGRF